MIDKKQRMAEHQWECGVILQFIFPKCSKELLFWTLVHDAGESFTGDVPAPLKRAAPQVRMLLDKLEKWHCEDNLGLTIVDLSVEEKIALKWADYLSGIFFCRQRWNAGDKEAKAILLTFVDYLKGMAHCSVKADELLSLLQKGL